MIGKLLTRDRFLWRNETKLRRLAADEIAKVRSLTTKVCAWGGLTKKEWKIAWASFARNDVDFHVFPNIQAKRHALLVEHDILGGAFKDGNGYFIVLVSPEDEALLRHELQHVIDDADNPSIYTSDCKTVAALEMRAVMAQLQTQNVNIDEIKRIYC